MRSSPKTYSMWNIKTIKNLPKIQFNLFRFAFEVLKIGGEIIYSTCTHAPEENEGVVNKILKEFGDKIEIQKVNLPFQARAGITEWENEKFDERVKLCARVYPQDSKFKRIK